MNINILPDNAGLPGVSVGWLTNRDDASGEYIPLITRGGVNQSRADWYSQRIAAITARARARYMRQRDGAPRPAVRILALALDLHLGKVIRIRSRQHYEALKELNEDRFSRGRFRFHVIHKPTKPRIAVPPPPPPPPTKPPARTLAMSANNSPAFTRVRAMDFHTGNVVMVEDRAHYDQLSKENLTYDTPRYRFTTVKK